MRFTAGDRVACFDDAVRLALQEAGLADVVEEAVNLFVPSADSPSLQVEGQKALEAGVRRRYGNKARWSGIPWFVPVPQLRYEASPTPLLVFTVQPYLAAGLTVRISGHTYVTNPVGPIGKPEKLTLPLEFLQAILDDRLDAFHIAAKDGVCTSWTVPFLREPLRLPDEFLARLTRELEGKSVASWLMGFGANGRSLMPQVVGSLLGLQFRTAAGSHESVGQAWDQAEVMETLVRMFGTRKAKVNFGQALPHLRANMTNEEAIRLFLQMAGREE